MSIKKTENQKVLWIIAAGMILFSFFLHLFSLDFSALQRVLWLISLSIVFFLLFKAEDTVPRCLLYGGYAVRVVLAAVNFCFGNFISNSVFRVGDDIVFAAAAREFYEGNLTYQVNSRIFPQMICSFYKLFGPDELVVILVLMAFAMVGCFSFWHLIKDLDIDPKIKMIALAAVCFAPYNIILSVLMLREPIYFCFVTLSFLLFRKYCLNNEPLYLVAAMFLCFPAILMHWGYAGILAVYLFCFFFRLRVPEEKKYRFRILRLALLVIMVLLTAVIVINSGRLKHFQEAGGFVQGIMLIFSKYSGLGGNSKYLEWMEVTELWQLFAYTPLRVLYFFLSPVPLAWRDMKDAASFLLDSLFPLSTVIVLVWFTVKNKKFPKLSAAAALWCILLSGAMFCWATTTAGAALRHRNCLMPLLIYSILQMIADNKSREF